MINNFLKALPLHSATLRIKPSKREPLGNKPNPTHITLEGLSFVSLSRVDIYFRLSDEDWVGRL